MEPIAPNVTVLMPVYNSEKYLKDAIESILNQTYLYRDFEFLIISEDSSDTTCSIIDHYHRLDDRIIVFHLERQGLIASLNKGCELARGKYIARMDADDISLPERLEKQVAFMDDHLDVGVCGSWAELIDENGNLIGNFCPPVSSTLIKWNLIFYCGIAHPSAVIRTESAKKLGFYCKDFLHCEDYDLWIRAIRHFEFANIPEFLLRLRKHDQNVTSVYYPKHNDNVLKVAQRAIALTLKQQIALDLICILRDPRCMKKASDARKASTILNSLCFLFINQNPMSDADNKQIKRETAIRLHDLAINCLKINKLYSVIIWSQAFQLSPIFSLGLMASTLKRITPLHGLRTNDSDV